MQIGKISINGFLAAAVNVQEQEAKSNLKEMTLEQGGKSPTIVFNDTNIDTELGYFSTDFLLNSGQVCVAASWAYIQEGIASEFIKQLYVQTTYHCRTPVDSALKTLIYVYCT
jgi:aldehyde dehydrogenase (NAD+)